MFETPEGPFYTYTESRDIKGVTTLYSISGSDNSVEDTLTFDYDPKAPEIVYVEFNGKGITIPAEAIKTLFGLFPKPKYDMMIMNGSTTHTLPEPRTFTEGNF